MSETSARKRKLNGGASSAAERASATSDALGPIMPLGQSVPHLPPAPAGPTPTLVNWSISDIFSAYEDLTVLLSGNPDGAFGYKASLVRTMLDSIVVAAQQDDTKLKSKYRKHVPKEGGGEMPLPDTQDGRPLPLSFWCSDPAAYTRDVNGIRNVVHSLSFPVRFTYQEVRDHREPVRDPLNNNTIVAWQGVRGSFWRNLMPLIDRDPQLAGVELPVVAPTLAQ